MAKVRKFVRNFEIMSDKFNVGKIRFKNRVKNDNSNLQTKTNGLGVNSAV